MYKNRKTISNKVMYQQRDLNTAKARDGRRIVIVEGESYFDRTGTLYDADGRVLAVKSNTSIWEMIEDCGYEAKSYLEYRGRNSEFKGDFRISEHHIPIGSKVRFSTSIRSYDRPDDDMIRTVQCVMVDSSGHVLIDTGRVDCEPLFMNQNVTRDTPPEDIYYSYELICIDHVVEIVSRGPGSVNANTIEYARHSEDYDTRSYHRDVWTDTHAYMGLLRKNWFSDEVAVGGKYSEYVVSSHDYLCKLFDQVSGYDTRLSDSKMHELFYNQKMHQKLRIKRVMSTGHRWIDVVHKKTIKQWFYKNLNRFRVDQRALHAEIHKREQAFYEDFHY